MKKEKKKVSIQQAPPTPIKIKREGKALEKKKKSGLLNHPLSLPGNHCAAWCCLYHCGTYQRRRTEGLGNGVAMATERSTHDVKAQRGLGRGKRGKGKKEKVYVRLQLLCFPVKWGPGRMERNRGCWQPLSATTTSVSQSAQSGETIGSMQPWPCTQPAKEQMPAVQNTIGNTVNLFFSTSSAFCKQHKETHSICKRQSKQEWQ